MPRSALTAIDSSELTVNIIMRIRTSMNYRPTSARSPPIQTTNADLLGVPPISILACLTSPAHSLLFTSNCLLVAIAGTFSSWSAISWTSSEGEWGMDESDAEGRMEPDLLILREAREGL